MRNNVHLICPQLKIPEKIWKRLRAYIDAVEVEVGGLGTVEMIDGNLVVTDIFLLEQEVDPSNTDLDPAAVAVFFNKWLMDGKDHNLLRFWWHSHATMGVGWSDKDHDTIERLAAGTFLVSYVGNHRGESLVRLTMQNPIRLAVDDLPFIVVPDIEAKLRDEVRDEVAAKVRKKGLLRRVFNRKPEPSPVVEKRLKADVDISDPFEGIPFERGGKS